MIPTAEPVQLLFGHEDITGPNETITRKFNMLVAAVKQLQHLHILAGDLQPHPDEVREP